MKFIVRRSTSFYNNEAIFSNGEGAGKSQMHVGLVECQIIFVSAYSTKCEIVLTYELIPCYESFPIIFMKLMQYIE